MLKEGVDPVIIENAGRAIGLPVGPLSVQDEVMMDMLLRGHKTNRDLDAALGDDYAETYAVCAELCARLCEEGRPGRAAGAGFYDYGPDGNKKLWAGLRDLFGAENEIPFEDVCDRLHLPYARGIRALPRRGRRTQYA